MMKYKKTAVSVMLGLGLLTACGGSVASSSTVESAVAADETSTTADETTTTSTADETSETADSGAVTTNPGDSVDAGSVASEEALIALIQEAYGDASLGLHRGHQPVESVLIEVLGISHDEMHVRMEEQGQNLAAVATDLGIEPQTLIDALVASWSPAIDGLLADGVITQDEADQYLTDLEEAFTFRVTWDGAQSEPTYTGLDV